MNHVMKHSLLIVILVLISLKGKAQSVIDKAGFLNSTETGLLDDKIREIKDKTSVEILVFIAEDLQGKSPLEYGLELSNIYGVGLKGINNGIILLISKNEKKLQLLNGYGIEWIITDESSKKIIDQMIPFLIEEEYYKSIERALTVINSKVETVDWSIHPAKVNEINANQTGKIIKINYTHKGGNKFKYPLASDDQFDNDFKIVLEVKGQKYNLFYSKYMKDYVGRIITGSGITIYARMVDLPSRRLELLGIE